MGPEETAAQAMHAGVHRDPSAAEPMVEVLQPPAYDEFAAAASERPDAQGSGPGLYGQMTPIDQVDVESGGQSDNLRRVTFSFSGSDFDAAVDPSGAMLVYASTQHAASSDLYLKHVNGTAVTQLTNDPANDAMPVFSPDGRRIAFASDRSGNWDIYMIDSNGGPAVQLTNDAGHDLHPSFSPDGSMLVYSSLSARSGQWEMVVIELNAPAAKRYVGQGLFPTWSPTGDKIAYQRAQQRGTNWFSIWVIELVNGEGVRPTQVAVAADTASIMPCWSPDGNWLAYCTVDNPESGGFDNPPQADIWITNAKGTGRANLTRSRFANLQPAWSSDGTIYFRSNRTPNNVENIWSTRPDRVIRTIEPIKQEQTAAVSTDGDAN